VLYLNLGGEDGASDITDKIKPFQNGNRQKWARLGRLRSITNTVKGETLSKKQEDDGSILRAPQRNCAWTISLNGKEMSKTVDIGHTLEVNVKGK
jgi:hypothetical protein